MDGTPSIRIHSHCHDHRYRSPPSHSRQSPQQPLHAPASPMSIPHSAQDSPSVPPPLPPPTHLYEDLTPQAQQKEWNFFNKEYLDQHWTDFGKAATVRPGSSLLGGNKAQPRDQSGDPSQQHEADASRRGSSMSTVTVPHRNSEAMIDPCDSDEAKLSGYRCVVLPSSSCCHDRINTAISSRHHALVTCLVAHIALTGQPCAPSLLIVDVLSA